MCAFKKPAVDDGEIIGDSRPFEISIEGLECIKAFHFISASLHAFTQSLACEFLTAIISRTQGNIKHGKKEKGYVNGS